MVMQFDPARLGELSAELNGAAWRLDAAGDRVQWLLSVAGRFSTAVSGLGAVADDQRTRAVDLAVRADVLRGLAPFMVSGPGEPEGLAELEEISALIAAIDAADGTGATEAELSDLERRWSAERSVIRALDPAELLDLSRWSDGAMMSLLFSTVTPTQRDALISLDPSAFGSDARVPLAVRFRANRLLVHRHLEAIEAGVATLREEIERLDSSWWRMPIMLPPPWPIRSTDLLPWPLQALDPADALRARVARLEGEMEQLVRLADRDLVLFDWHEAGRVAEWLGPLDARHVAVYLPGTGHSKQTIDQLRDRADIMLAHGADDIAVVTAMVYDAPDNVLEAALARYAIDGRGDIADFVGGLEAPGRHLTVVAHSYGSTALGEALRHGLAGSLGDDDDVVILGSPGVRADTAEELGVPGVVWAAQTEGDEIGATGALHDALCAAARSAHPWGQGGCEFGERYHHGVNPVHPSFGAKVFETGSIPDHGVGILDEFGDEHGEYWAVIDGVPSEALSNLLRIVIADYEAVTLVGAD